MQRIIFNTGTKLSKCIIFLHLDQIRKIIFALFLTIISLGVINAQTVSGGWDAAGTTGTAGYTNHGNGVIQLISTDQAGCAGAAVHETTDKYDPTSGAVFNKCYEVFFGCPGNDDIGSDTKGDGLAFSFSKCGFNINNGLACGGGLGYMGSCPQMFTIEFDTWSSQCLNNFDCTYGGGNSGNNDEIAIHINGDASDAGRLHAINAGNLEDGLEHTVCINYNPATNVLSIYIDGVLRLSYNYNLAAYFGAGGLNQTWSSGKHGATNPATVTNGADITDNIGAPLCPASVIVTSPANGNIFETCDGPVTITAVATPPVNNTVTHVEFFVNGSSIGSDNTAPYSLPWNNLTLGNHVITAVAHFVPSGTNSTSSTVTVTVSQGVQQTAVAPVIDGTPDALWNSFPSYSLTRTPVGPANITGPADLSATYKMTYDANNLYVLVDVNDEDLRNDGGDPWDNDGVELFIDKGNDKNPTYGANDFQFAFVYNNTSVVEYKHNATAGVTYANAVKTGGYAMEIRIPWSTIGGAPVPGEQIGFDVHVNDDDGGGTRDSKIAWNDANDNAYHSPAAFGTIKISNCEPCPNAPVAGSNNTLCVGGTISLTASNVAGAVSYNWTGPNGFTSTQQNPVINNATLAMSGTYSVTATNAGGCVSAAATTNVTVNNDPAAPAVNSNSPLCVGGTISLTASDVTGAISYSWTGPDGFTSTTQNPSISDATTAKSGSYSVTVSTAGSGCTSAPASVMVTVNNDPAAPVVNSNSPLCVGGTISLTASNVAGSTSYNWTGPDGFTSTTQNPTITDATTAKSGSYSVTVSTAGSGCTSVATSVTVTINNDPVSPTVNSNSPMCVGGTISLTASNVAGATSYNWTGPDGFTSTTQNPTITDATTAKSGSYTVTVSTAGSGCTSAPASVTVTVNTNPSSPTAQSNGPVCAGETINLLAGNVAEATYSWTGPDNFTSTQQNPTLENATTTMAGTYTVIAISGAGCQSSPATVNVVVNPRPQVSVNNSSVTICTGNSVQMVATGSGGSGTYSYLWSPATDLSSVNTATTTANPSADITYSVIVTDDNNCSAEQASVVVTVVPNLQPVISGPAELCMNAQNVRYFVSNPTQNSSFNWLAADGVTVVSSQQNEVYVNITSVSGTLTVVESTSTCNGQDDITIDVNPNPTLSVNSANVEICNGQSATLEASANGGTGAYTFNWTPLQNIIPADGASASVTVNPTTDAVYFVSVVDEKGCSDQDGKKQVIVTVNANPALTVNSSNVEMCEGTSATLSANASGGSGALVISWSPLQDILPSDGRSGSVTVNPSSDRIYFVEVEDAKGCKNTNGSLPVNVKVNPNPVLSVASPLVETCRGNSAQLTANASGGTAPMTFTWTPATDIVPSNGIGQSVTVNPSEDRTYTVTLVDSKGCSDPLNASMNVSVVVNIAPANISILGDVNAACASSTGLEFTVSPYNGASQYNWTVPSGFTITSQVGDKIIISSNASPQTGLITVSEITDKNCTTSQPASRSIAVNPSTPTAVINGSDRNICGGSVSLKANNPSMNGIAGAWSSVPHAIIEDVNNPLTSASGFTANTIIKWTLTGPCGVSEDEINVNLVSSAIAVNAAAAADTLCAGIAADISASISGSTAAPFTYTWTDSDGNIVSQSENSTITVNSSKDGWNIYKVVVRDANGCTSDIAEAGIFAITQQALVVPNLITPNGDDKNDCLIIRDINSYDIIPGGKFNLYNRWGQAVYKSEFYKNGDFCGADLADGVYYYNLKTSCDGREIKGWLHIISGDASQ
ncbi:MAG: sugar-binding protein [Cytophagaceae bacterium]